MSTEPTLPRGLLTLVQGITLDEVEEIVEEVNPEAEEKHLASSDYYWNSYAHFGIHEVRCLFLRSGGWTKRQRTHLMHGWIIGDAKGRSTDTLVPKRDHQQPATHQRQDRTSLTFWRHSGTSILLT